MQEEVRKDIPGYKGLYEMTVSGRVYSVKSKRFLARCEDEYGFHIVKLSKQGSKVNHNVFELWKETFKDYNLPEYEFKGALKVIYK
ncbi:NUMOD4 domain-containing protein [Metabacillus litoralis]|nr:NUMOD4 domain-containing protein [Metabacillus litoralis]